MHDENNYIAVMAIQKYFILIFKILISHHAFMTHFHMCKLWTELQLVILVYGTVSFECSQIFLQDWMWTTDKYTTGFALLSCQLGKTLECKTILFFPTCN